MDVDQIEEDKIEEQPSCSKLAECLEKEMLDNCSGDDELEPKSISYGEPDESLKKRRKRQLEKKSSSYSLKTENILQNLLKGRDDRLNMMKEMMERNKDKKAKCDVDLFFESIASTVKKFSPASIAKAKIEVLNVVTKIELGSLQNELDNTSSTPTNSHSTTMFSVFDNEEQQDSVSMFQCFSLPINEETTEAMENSPVNY